MSANQLPLDLPPEEDEAAYLLPRVADVRSSMPPMPEIADGGFPGMMPFGVKGLRGWKVGGPEREIALPMSVAQIRLYAMLRALEARADSSPARITGVRGVRIMRVVALLSTAPEAAYAVVLPFGVRRLGDWYLPSAGYQWVVPPTPAQLRLYVLLRGLEARTGGRPARITGVQGVRIMRLISMMSDFPGAIQTVALPFGVRGLHDWRLRMNGRDFPNLQRTFEDTRAPLFAPASIAPARTGMRRVGLGMAACTLGALGCLAWVMSHDGDLPDKAVVPMRAVALVRVPAPQRPVSAPTSVSSEMDRLLDVHTTIKPVTRAAAQLAATPSGRATAHSHARVHTRMPTHTAQQARHSPVRMATADMPGRPAHATADMPQHDQALPGWLSDGPSALEDYRTLTGATSDEHSPGVRHASAPPVDPTEWARHVTQRRITETPDAFVH